MTDPNQIVSITDRLNEFFKTAETEKDFPWNSVLEYLKDHKKDVLAFNNAPIFCDFFTKILEALDISEDIAVFTAIINIITVLLLKNEGRDFPGIHNWDSYEYFFRSKREEHLALSMFYLSKKRNENIFPEREGIQVVNAIKTGNHRLMQVLATNGYNVNISNDCFFARHIAGDMIKKFLSVLDYQVDWIRNPFRIYCYPRSGFSEFRDVAGVPDTFLKKYRKGYKEPKLPNLEPYLDCYDLLYLGEDPLWRPKSVGFKRLFVIVLGIHALGLKLKNRPELTNFVKCLEIYFKTISEPYIAVSEIKNLFIKYFTRIRKENLLEDWCKVFKDTMPFCARNHEPRRLSHLARCQVRQNLSKVGNSLFPAILHQMIMPKEIKEFLLCKSSEENA